jgi:hypothetical protein
MRKHFLSSVGMLLIFWMLFAACTKEQETIYSVPDELQSFVDTLVSEAGQRGVKLDVSNNLIIEYGLNTEGILCGSCVFVGKQLKIEINQENKCWSDRITQEALMLHMLGHCALRRIDHDDALLPNGDAKSLMNGEFIDQYACIFDLSGENNCNNLYKRDYYLDELFDPNTPAPDWSK